MDMLGSASSLGLHGFGAAAAAGTAAAGFTDHLAGSLGLDGHTASAAADFMGHHAAAAMPHAAAAYSQHHHHQMGYHHHHHHPAHHSPHQNAAAYGSLYQSPYPGFSSAAATAHQGSDSHHHSQVLANCRKLSSDATSLNMVS